MYLTTAPLAPNPELPRSGVCAGTQPSSRSEDTTPATAAKRTVLVVDDRPANIDLLCDLLGPMYTVRVATNGPLALKLAAMAPAPDLILLDVMMPGMDGYEVCTRLKASAATRAIPVIFITARADAKDVARGFDLGAADYITKPFDVRIVLARVRTQIALHDERLFLEDLVHDRTQRLEKLQMELIFQLGRAAEFRSNETSAHTMRMAHFARLLGRHAGMSERQADTFLYAAMMHDVGKIGIPDNILLKQGKLSDEEFAAMKLHPEIGARIIGHHDAEVLQMAREVALTHHEKWNGTGYPHGLKGEAIPLSGRVAALADVFDALTSPRPYKKAWSVADALAYIKDQAGEHFDPILARMFVSLEAEIRQIQATYKDTD
jgi:putative two-component system response regulator